MAGLQDFRAKHPEYNDMPDAALADALYKKFYSDMPREQFDAKLGLPAAGAGGDNAAQAATGPAPAHPYGGGVFGPMAEAAAGMVDQLNAGFQKTSPVNNGQYGKPVGKLVQSDSPSGYNVLAPGLPWTEFDPQQMVALRDPGTGEMMVYRRSAQTNEGMLPSLGRVLSVGAMAPATAPLVTAAPAMTKAGQALKDFEVSKITPRLPAVVNNRGLSIASNVIKDTPVAGNPVVQGMRQTINEAGDAASRLATRYGSASQPVQAGRSLQQGAEAFVNSGAEATPSIQQAMTMPTRNLGFAQKADALYERIGIAPSATVQLDGTMGALNSIVSKFQSNPALGKLLTDPKLLQVQKALKAGRGRLTWAEARDFRSWVGRKLADPVIVADIPRAELEGLYAGLSSDLQTTAKAAGRLKEFEQADAYYRAGLQRIADSLKATLGAKSPEAAYQQILAMSMAKGGSADIGRLLALKRSLPAEQWYDVAATMLETMGKPTAGAAEGGVTFSPATFMTNWAKMSDQARAAIFDVPGSPGIRQQLDALVRSADRLKSVEKLGNPSGSGRYAMGGLALTGMVNAPVTTTLTMAGQYGVGKLLMSPGFTNWLLGASKIRTAEQWAAHIQKLRALGQMSTTGARDALLAIANDLSAGSDGSGRSPSGR